MEARVEYEFTLRFISKTICLRVFEVFRHS